MERNETLDRLQSLFDRVHRTAERGDHLQERVPLPVQTRSLNYAQDLENLQGEYRRLVSAALAEGVVNEIDLAAAGLPRLALEADDK